MTVLVNKNGHPISGPTTERTNARYTWEVNETFFDTDLNQLMVYTGAAGWKSADSYTGPVSSVVNAAGNAIGNATALAVWGFNQVDLADGTKGVQLPVGVNGRSLVIKNLTNGQALKVYPQVNAAINLLGANNAISMASNTVARYHAMNATQWYTEPAVPS